MNYFASKKNHNNFELLTFKTKPCKNTQKHKEKQCIYYHSEKDKRRNLKHIFYLPEPCPKMQSCHNPLCKYSHNTVEEFYHPNKFKTKFCEYYSKNKLSQCDYGPYCSFAHNESEIRIALLENFPQDEFFFINYFKTILCPNSQCNAKSTCVYSHNWQDYRRSPLHFYYRNISCPKWSNKKMIINYSDGCPDGVACQFCHGWKEEDYHPLNYKTKKCKFKFGTCKKGKFCPFYHQNEKKREVPPDIIEKYNRRKYSGDIRRDKNYNYIGNSNNSSVNSFNKKNNSFTLISKKYSFNSVNDNSDNNSNYSDNKSRYSLYSNNSNNSNNNLASNLGIQNNNMNNILNVDDSYEEMNELDYDNIQKKNQQLNNILENLNLNCDEYDFQNNTQNISSINDFMEYLHKNNFLILYKVLSNKELAMSDLINFSDDKLKQFIEKSNANKYSELKEMIIKLEQVIETEDMLKDLNDKIDFGFSNI